MLTGLVGRLVGGSDLILAKTLLPQKGGRQAGPPRARDPAEEGSVREPRGRAPSRPRPRPAAPPPRRPPLTQAAGSAALPRSCARLRGHRGWTVGSPRPVRSRAPRAGSAGRCCPRAARCWLVERGLPEPPAPAPFPSPPAPRT